jgi:potassium-transporting ATPase potassium-binding subunit
VRLAGWFEISLTLALVLAAAYPIGAFMADVFDNRKTFLTPLLGPVERAFYRLAGVDPEVEQKWVEYALSMVVFGGGCLFALYALLRVQAYLPLNPRGFPGVPPDLAFNIAISFITNANWQAYGGETTLSHLSQMAGLTANNFLDSAAATAIAVALTRALARNETPTIGNFWVDMTRATLYILLPLSIVVALAFAALGVPQTLSGSVEATTLEGVKQVVSIGPVASQEAIKLLGDNGGGFFNANSAHPFENPSAWSNMLQNWSQLVLPVALVFAFGRMVGDRRQGRVLLIAMTVIFAIALVFFYWAETRGNPALTGLGVDPSFGNMEGKDLRFGQAGAALFVDATTGTGTGASNAALESMAPVGGLVAMFNLMLGCISPGASAPGSIACSCSRSLPRSSPR